MSEAAKTELAPNGTLRVGVNHSNHLLVTPGSPHGAPRGEPGVTSRWLLWLTPTRSVPLGASSVFAASLIVRSSFGLDAGEAHRLRPFFDLGLQQHAEFLRRARVG